MELIAEHGGKLIDRVLRGEERNEALEKARTLRKLEIDSVAISDLELIAVGVFSPLTGFMKKADYDSVVTDMRLDSGVVWSIPITLSVSPGVASSIDIDEEIALTDANASILAILRVEEKFGYDKGREAENVYRTTETAHPGVARLYRQGDILLGGEVFLLDRKSDQPFSEFRHDPAQSRRIFADRGWTKVVGFQTRNPIHRAHEYIQKCALEIVDGLFLHPLVGDTKKGDTPADIRMQSYESLLRGYYPPERTLLGVFPAAMRYAGPREAIFHALCRKNYGCTHFIVGRDHAGVGNYYGTYDAQRIFSEFKPDEIGLTPLFFDHTYYCTKCGGIVSDKTCPHDQADRLILSGTQVREMLARGEAPSPEFTRPEVASILIEGCRQQDGDNGTQNGNGKNGFTGNSKTIHQLTKGEPSDMSTEKACTIWFTGLPSSGKSTLAEMLEKELRRRSRKVETLDGDVVRTNLSRGLTFSKEDRDINIRRIGFVCHLMTRNDVFAISAAISPYRSLRDENRELIGDFVEVFVNCPVEECIKRDVKGLYKKALAGEIKTFTGVSDPYEEPLNAEITVFSESESAEESLQKILATLVELGYLADESPAKNGSYAEEEALQEGLV